MMKFVGLNDFSSSAMVRDDWVMKVLFVWKIAYTIEKLNNKFVESDRINSNFMIWYDSMYDSIFVFEQI